VESHAEFLRRVTLEPGLVEAIRTDYTKANVSASDRAMLDYVAELTLRPSLMSREHVQRLHAAGFDDRAILQINLIASWFCYINRVADGLGVGRAP
jgi:uncharacterized peroxidase-related enzyme